MWSERATRFRELDLPFGRRSVERQDAGCETGERVEMSLQRAAVPANHRPGQRGANPERFRVAQRLLDEAAVDGERPLLIEARSLAELRDRVEQRDESACGEDGGSVIRSLAPRSEADGGGPERLGHTGEERGQLVVALDRHRRAVERGD